MNAMILLGRGQQTAGCRENKRIRYFTAQAGYGLRLTDTKYGGWSDEIFHGVSFFDSSSSVLFLPFANMVKKMESWKIKNLFF